MLPVKPACSLIVGIAVEGKSLAAPISGRLHRKDPESV